MAHKQPQSQHLLNESEKEIQLSSRIELLQKQHDALNTDLVRLEEEKKESANLQKQLAEIKESIEIEKDSLQSLRKEKGEVNDTVSSLKKDVVVLEKEIEQLQASRLEIDKQIKTAEEEGQKVRLDVSAVLSRLTTSKREEEHVTLRLVELEKTVAELSAQKSELLKLIDGMPEQKKELDALKDELTRVKSSLSVEQGHLKMFTEQVMLAKQESVRILNEAKSSADAYNEKTQMLLRRREDQIDAREGEVSRKTAFLDDRQKKLQLYKTQMESHFGRTFDLII